MCWHKWDVKKRVIRIFFDQITFGQGTLAALVVSGVSIAAIMAVGSSGKELSSGDGLQLIDIFGCWIFFTGLVAGLYVAMGLLGGMVLEEWTQKEDKICLKCHLTILDASHYEKTISIPYRDRVKARERLEKEIKENADTMFSARKKMWEKARVVSPWPRPDGSGDGSGHL